MFGWKSEIRLKYFQTNCTEAFKSWLSYTYFYSCTRPSTSGKKKKLCKWLRCGKRGIIDLETLSVFVWSGGSKLCHVHLFWTFPLLLTAYRKTVTLGYILNAWIILAELDPPFRAKTASGMMHRGPSLELYVFCPPLGHFKRILRLGISDFEVSPLPLRLVAVEVV